MPSLLLLSHALPPQEKRIAAEIEGLERDTGYKLRVLAQVGTDHTDTGGSYPALRLIATPFLTNVTTLVVSELP